ncbi:MAG TPA: carboxypeptidase-like regulatory domain-containing protein [Pyrinomonadaceae bacterium]|nr:carboxypeptidase-like regulatory domain-containing protein [Pyrinomonadaceae bacterium]
MPSPGKKRSDRKGGHARARACLLAALCLLAPALRPPGYALAQSATATLGGSLTDEAGAVVPAVQITVLNLGTALQRHAQTDASGYFTIPLLPPGRYALTARREGFATIEVRNVALHVNDQKVLRIKLRVGEVGEVVHVTEDLLGAQAAGATGTVVDRGLIAGLPLNGRSFQSLFELAPGTVLTRASFNEQGQFSVNGQRANANYFTVDGVSANVGVSAGAAPGQAAGGSLPALTVLGGTNNLVSADALEEFRVQTSSYAPEFGRTPGAQVSLVTRSGTNQLRGTLFEYFRHDALDANDFFANSRRLGKSRLRQHDFGGTLGGPLARDRAFFFAAYEGLRLRQPQVAITEVPSLAARRDAPASLRPYLDAFPAPRGRDLGNGFAEFSAGYSDPSRLDAASLRVDVSPGPNLTLFARYNHSPSETVQRGGVVIPGFGRQSLNTLNRTRLETRTLTAAAVAALTPNVTNDLRFNWSRALGETSLSMDDFGGATPLPDSALLPGGASFRLVLRGGLDSNYGRGLIARNTQQQFNVVETLSVVRGASHLKFGADFRLLLPTYGPPRHTQTAIFGEGQTNGSAAAVSGRAAQVQVGAETGPREPVFKNFSAFAQNTWRVSPRLTFTYGLRWELNPPPRERRGNDPFIVEGLRFIEDGDIVNFNFGSIINRPQLPLAPRGTPLWKTTYNNFAPRAGFAYQLPRTDGTVLRGGVGIFYDLGNGPAGLAFGSAFPYRREKVLSNVPFPLDPEQAAPPPLNLDPPYGTFYAFDPRLKLPYSAQWNLGVEHPLGSRQLVSVAYVAALGRRLLRETGLLAPDPKFTLIRVVTNTSGSDYHAMQAHYQRRLAAGLQAQAYYAWSHSIDDDSDDSSALLFRGLDTRQERGSSNFDVRHSLTAAVTYELPAAPSKSPLARALLGGWSVDAFLRARSATPFNVLARTGLVIGDLVEVRRPDLAGGVPVYIDDPSAPGGRRLNPAAFAAAPGRQGTLGRNSLRGFGFSQVDLAVRRRFALSERAGLQLRAEFFNALNRPNFGDPVNELGSRLFGEPIQTLGRSLGTGGVNGGLSPLYQIGGPRSIQLALRLDF